MGKQQKFWKKKEKKKQPLSTGIIETLNKKGK